MRTEEDEWHVQAMITHVHVQNYLMHVPMTMRVIKLHQNDKKCVSFGSYIGFHKASNIFVGREII